MTPASAITVASASVRVKPAGLIAWASSFARLIVPLLRVTWSPSRSEHDDGDADEADGGTEVVEAVGFEAVHDDAPGE